MGKTLQVIRDRTYDQTRSYHPGEIADGRFADLTNPPSLAALKLHEVLFKAAGAAVADDRWHKIDLAAIRAVDGMKNYDRRGLVELFKELRSVVMEYDTERETVIAGLLDVAKVEFEDGTGPAIVRWKFGEGFREIAAKSNYWAIIDRQTALSMSSRYSLRLYEIIALRVNLDRKSSEVFTLADLRARLGVPAGKLVRWAHLNQFALKPAIAEVNQLSRFTVSMQVQKRGRNVVAVEFTWSEKPDLAETRRELDRPKAGRKVRREGAAETIVENAASPDAFPSGSIRYTVWAEAAYSNLPSDGTPDIDRVAERFRAWCAERTIPLSGPTVMKRFESWCRNEKPIR
jgi:hypothetical protein